MRRRTSLRRTGLALALAGSLSLAGGCSVDLDGDKPWFAIGLVSGLFAGAGAIIYAAIEGGTV